MTNQTFYFKVDQSCIQLPADERLGANLLTGYTSTWVIE